MKFLKAWVLPFLGVALYRLISWTWRMQVTETEALKLALAQNKSIVFAHWHGDELVLLAIARRYRICAMVSTSSDGDIMNRVVRLMGGATSRGSSTRGGVSALKGLLKNVRRGYRPSVAVDGPKGPIYQVKPGIFEISKLLNAEIHPIGVSASSKWVFHKSWNKTFLPKPFAKLTLAWGQHLPALTADEDPRALKCKTSLEQTLNDAKRKAESLLIAAR